MLQPGQRNNSRKMISHGYISVKVKKEMEGEGESEKVGK
jgi:hypothetical protein